jgi:Rhodopirellula transposase DDE domain
MNWRGRPLGSHEVIVELIGATTTHTVLQVRAQLGRGRYPLGVKVRDEELAAGWAPLPPALLPSQPALIRAWQALQRSSQTWFHPLSRLRRIRRTAPAGS